MSKISITEKNTWIAKDMFGNPVARKYVATQLIIDDSKKTVTICYPESATGMASRIRRGEFKGCTQVTLDDHPGESALQIPLTLFKSPDIESKCLEYKIISHETYLFAKEALKRKSSHCRIM